MKPRLDPLLAMLLVANCGLAMSNADVTVASALPERIARDVQIHAFTDKGVHVPPPDIEALISNAMSEAFSNSASGLASFPRNTVKNAPYSAEVISEKNQALPDGNLISRRASTLTYRDSAGRTRQETRDTNGDVLSIHIDDAVEGTRFVISPSTKTATKIGLHKDLRKHIDEISGKARAMVKEAKNLVTIQSEKNGGTVVVKRSEESTTDGKKEIREEVKVRVIRANDTPRGQTEAHAFSFSSGQNLGHAIGESMRFGPIGMSFQDSKWSSKSTSAELGTRDFDGVGAEGKQRSYTIPAGEIGNKNPITVTSETWYSPELQVTVYSKQSDPRSGDSIYRLANVKRTEQPLSLFRVPADYATRDGLNIGAPAPKAEPPIK